ncbi:MAG: hypothetical protein LDL09_05725 [Calditerrivibrio sp.]|nr:hypothetical protein [Calditerrivibrio sp.]
MNQFEKRFKTLLLTAIIINLLIIVINFYSMNKSVQQIRKHMVDLGSFIIKTMENSPRFFGGQNNQGLKLLAGELAKQDSVKNIIIYDDGKMIYAYDEKNLVDVEKNSDRKLLVKEVGEYIVIQKNIEFKRGGMSGRWSPGWGMFKNFSGDNPPPEMKYDVVLLLSTDPIKNMEKGFFRNIMFFLIAEILLVVTFMMMLKLFRKYQQTMEQLNRYEKDAQLGRMANMLAHEVKNPLSSMKGFTEYVYERVDSEELADYMDRVLDEIDRLNRIVNDFLIYGREVNLDKTKISLRDLLNRNISMLEQDAKLKNIILQLNGDDFYIEADRDKITQVFLNLLLNAIQGSEENSVVRINIGKGRVYIENDVKKSSIIDKEKLFSPFYTTKSKGSGLGLAISKKILESHGFFINIESTSPFVVRIDFGDNNA